MDTAEITPTPEQVRADRRASLTLKKALAALVRVGAQARPYSARIESAGNEEIGDVIALWADQAHRGSRSDAIRDLITRGAGTLVAERA